MVKFLLEIITPQRLAFAEEVESVAVPTDKGTIGVLAHHEPLFSVITEGEIKISTGSKEFFLAIGGGFMEVSGGKVSILVSRAVHAHELNESEIRRAQQSARDVIAKKGTGDEMYQAQMVLRRALLDLKVARRHKPRQNL